METKQSKTPKWDWIPCSYNLKTEVKKKIETWSLSPQVLMVAPNDDSPDPQVRLFIDTEKPLQYSDELGWNWHKSWNLPNISVRLEIKDSVTFDTLLCPRNIYVKLFNNDQGINYFFDKQTHLIAVKAIIDQIENFHLVDVGMRGTNKLELVNGQAFLSALKFNSTSYNNEGVKFHLLLLLYIQNSQNEVPKVIAATISPPIFVDSRKSARDQQIIQVKKASSYVEPFLPENLEKIFIKRENKKKNDTEIKVLNNQEGLFNYLTAPNIRHKVKHPLFIALKFSSCSTLFFNKNQFENFSKEEIIEILQKKLSVENIDTFSSQQAGVKKQVIDYADKFFILFIEEQQDQYKQKKIVEAVEILECETLAISYSLTAIPKNFLNICNSGSQEDINLIVGLYKMKYNKLMQIQKQFRKIDSKGGFNEDDNEEEEEEEEEEENESGSDQEDNQDPEDEQIDDDEEDENNQENNKSNKNNEQSAQKQQHSQAKHAQNLNGQKALKKLQLNPNKEDEKNMLSKQKSEKDSEGNQLQEKDQGTLDNDDASENNDSQQQKEEIQVKIEPSKISQNINSPNKLNNEEPDASYQKKQFKKQGKLNLKKSKMDKLKKKIIRNKYSHPEINDDSNNILLQQQMLMQQQQQQEQIQLQQQQQMFMQQQQQQFQQQQQQLHLHQQQALQQTQNTQQLPQQLGIQQPVQQSLTDQNQQNQQQQQQSTNDQAEHNSEQLQVAQHQKDQQIPINSQLASQQLKSQQSTLLQQQQFPGSGQLGGIQTIGLQLDPHQQVLQQPTDPVKQIPIMNFSPQMQIQQQQQPFQQIISMPQLQQQQLQPYQQQQLQQQLQMQNPHMMYQNMQMQSLPHQQQQPPSQNYQYYEMGHQDQYMYPQQFGYPQMVIQQPGFGPQIIQLPFNMMNQQQQIQGQVQPDQSSTQPQQVQQSQPLQNAFIQQGITQQNPQIQTQNIPQQPSQQPQQQQQQQIVAQQQQPQIVGQQQPQILQQGQVNQQGAQQQCIMPLYISNFRMQQNYPQEMQPMFQYYPNQFQQPPQQALQHQQHMINQAPQLPPNQIAFQNPAQQQQAPSLQQPTLILQQPGNQQSLQTNQQ